MLKNGGSLREQKEQYSVFRIFRNPGLLFFLFPPSRTRAFKGPKMPLVATFRVDWFRVITDITRTGVTLYEIASEVGVSKSAVCGWKSGAEPKHGDGENLIAYWCRITKRERDRLPMFVYRQQFIFRGGAV